MKDKTLIELVKEYGENCAEIELIDNNYRIQSGKHNGDFYQDKHERRYMYAVKRNEQIMTVIDGMDIE